MLEEKSNLPEFSDYRATNDAAMVADVGFKKQLWALDPELDVVWDWASEKWEIWRFPGQGKTKTKNPADLRAHHVMTIETREKGFRELGADILLKLQQGDTHKFELKQIVAYFDQMDKNLQRAQERNMKARFEALGIETRWFFKGLRVQVPKNLPIFERPKMAMIGGIVNG
jgi:hypothetical protein